MPPYLAQVLYIVAILAEYGHHLAATLERRAASRSFSTIARYFGTANLSVILAHIHRGVMRAVALDRMLRLRAARGHELKVLLPRGFAQREAKAAALADAAASGQGPAEALLASAEASAAPTETQAGAAVAPAAAVRPVRWTGPGAPLTLATLPTMAQMEAEVRRRPVGSSVVAICRDLGVSPGLCESTFWNRIFMVIYGFRGSFNNIVLEMRKREKKFERDVQDRTRTFDWPEESREGIRHVLGFMVGETPVDPFSVVPSPHASVAAAATGPP